MAAPEEKTIHNLNGKWQMNKTLSGPFESILSLQGIGFLTRKAIGAATVTLSIYEHQAPPTAEALVDGETIDSSEEVTHIDIDQTLTGGIKGTSEKRCVDNRKRTHSDWLFGSVEGRTLWVKGPEAVVREFGDEFLGQGFTGDEDLIVSCVVNKDKGGGWVATQTWGFQTVPADGKRHYVRNVVVTKGDQRVAVQLVYDFVGERDKKDEDDGLSY